MIIQKITIKFHIRLTDIEKNRFDNSFNCTALLGRVNDYESSDIGRGIGNSH